MNRPLFVSLALLLAAANLAAQEPKPAPATPRWSWTRPVVRYGKWVTAATAGALTVLGAREHHQSSESWNNLLGICRRNNADCAIGPDGLYVDPLAEANYQRALYYDARARKRLVAGQIALVISAAMFIADLRGGRNGPPNIPFDPNKLLVEPTRDGGTRVGLRLAW
jgi:hypothetical protein